MMSVDSLPELWPVVETPYSEGLWPCTIARDRAYVRLSGEMSAKDIGAVFAQLVDYNRIEGPDIGTLAAGIVAAERLVLPGGLQASWRDQEINPSCCCGLENWREWDRFLSGGAQPWLGHDPAPWVEADGNLIRVWSDGGLAAAPDAFAIAFERRHIEAEIARAGQELRTFLEGATEWARSSGFSQVEAVRRKLDACFHLSNARSLP